MLRITNAALRMTGLLICQQVLAIFFIFYLFSNIATAESLIACPSVQEIKNNDFRGWLPLYKEGEELASPADVLIFREKITGFTVAKWNKVYLENAHCFYQGNHPVFEKLILAHDAFRPATNTDWVWIQLNSQAECYSETARCVFIQ